MRQHLPTVRQVIGFAAIVVALLIVASDDNVLAGIDLFEFLLFLGVLWVVLREW